MKRFNIYLLAIASLLALSCSAQKDDESYSAASIRTLSEIVGFYSLTSLEWEEPVDISGNGLVSSNLLLQMKTYGFFGPVFVHYGDEPETFSVFDANIAMMPGDTYGFANVKLYIPYFMHDMTDGTIGPSDYAQNYGFCPVNMFVYQFDYVVDRKGDIETIYMNQCGVENDNSFIYDNISLVLDRGCIYFEGDTSLYDYNSGEFVEGRISATYMRP